MTKPYISDHAVLRYLERYRGIDIEAVRSSIAEKVWPAIEMGAVNITIDGLCFALQGSTVVTVLPRRTDSASRQKYYGRTRSNGT